jgi:hypothetical protein
MLAGRAKSLPHHMFIGDSTRATPRFARVVGLLQSSTAIGTLVLTMFRGEIRISTVKKTKKAGFLKKF